MNITATPIISNRFWVIKENGKRVGLLSKDKDEFLYQTGNTTQCYDSLDKLMKSLGTTVVFSSDEIEKNAGNSELEIYGFPTNTEVANYMYDIKRKLPLFTKSKKSSSMYAAGYYIILFNAGWLRSFCPKLSTLDSNEYKGPFTTETEMKAQLSISKKEE